MVTAMEETQKRIEAATLDIAGTIRDIALFCSVAGLCWWAANDFSVAEPLGFDPLRYEFYARYGIPAAYLDSSSFRIVLVLEFIYTYLPYYVGYIFFISIICLGIRYFDENRLLSIAIFSPISFYYLPQTGKDGIAVLAAISAAILVSSRKNLGILLFSIFVISLAFYIRPAVILIIPLVLVQFRFGTTYAVLLSIFMGILFSFSSDTYSILSNLEGLAGDEGAGQIAQLIRQYTFGYEIQAIFAKMSLLLFSVFFQPALGFLKFYLGSPLFVLFEGVSFLAFGALIVREKYVMKFLVSSLPYVIIIGASSPFYHFRYLAVAYPVIWAYCRYSSGWGFKSARIEQTRQDYSHRQPILNFMRG
jgi:hypothetical protein